MSRIAHLNAIIIIIIKKAKSSVVISHIFSIDLDEI